MLDPYHVFDPDRPTISKSELDLINHSPAKYKRQIIDGIKPKATANLIFGQAFHMAVLEPLEFDDRFAVLPDDLAALNKNTKAYKEGLVEFKQEQVATDGQPKEILTPADAFVLNAMAESVFAHPLACELLAKVVHVEKAFYWRDERLGVDCRCKPDFVTSCGVVGDLKSTRDRLDDWHAQSAVKWRYDVQQVHYMAGLMANGIDVSDFQFVVVEKSAPYSCAVMGFEPGDVEQARQEWRMDLGTYAACLKSGNWPRAYEKQNEVVRRHLPTWRRNRY
jgi:hypothetical protein